MRSSYVFVGCSLSPTHIRTKRGEGRDPGTGYYQVGSGESPRHRPARAEFDHQSPSRHVRRRFALRTIGPVPARPLTVDAGLLPLVGPAGTGLKAWATKSAGGTRSPSSVIRADNTLIVEHREPPNSDSSAVGSVAETRVGRSCSRGRCRIWGSRSGRAKSSEGTDGVKMTTPLSRARAANESTTRWTQLGQVGARTSRAGEAHLRDLRAAMTQKVLGRGGR